MGAMASRTPWLDDLDVAQLNSDQLRALAHPTRNRIVSSLRIHGPATSARLADRLDTNTGQTSYHLRTLADVGLVVEDVGAGTERERWWRAAHRGHSWSETTFADDPADAHASDWLQRFYQSSYRRWNDAWLDERHQWPEAWQRAASTGDGAFLADPERATAFADDLAALIRRYQAMGETYDDDADVHRVFCFYSMFPADDLDP